MRLLGPEVGIQLARADLGGLAGNGSNVERIAPALASDGWSHAQRKREGGSEQGVSRDHGRVVFHWVAPTHCEVREERLTIIVPLISSCSDPPRFR